MRNHFHSQTVRVWETANSITLTPITERREFSVEEKIAAAQALIGMLPPDADLDAARKERWSR